MIRRLQHSYWFALAILRQYYMLIEEIVEISSMGIKHRGGVVFSPSLEVPCICNIIFKLSR